MSIRLPLVAVGTFDDSAEVGAGSVVGGVQHLVTIPQDTDNVVVKLTASVMGTGVSVVFQTTDDGGTTYYDVARTSIVSNANNDIAEWLSIPVIGSGYRSSPGIASTVAVGSVVSVGSVLGSTGSAAASTLGQKQVSGLPLLSQQARIFVIINGNVTSAASNSIITTVKVNSQSATA